MQAKISNHAFLSILIIIQESSFAGGIGSQSWGDGLSDSGGASNLSGWNILWIISIFAACYWLAFSSKSPLAERGFLWQLAMFLFGPAILVTTVISLTK